MHIGQFVAKLRAAHGESLRDAAARTGVSHTTIARIENGHVSGSMHDTLCKIANGYGVTMEYLMTGETAGQDFSTAFRLQAASSDGDAQVPTETVSAYVSLMRKAIDAGLDVKTLDMAIDLLILEKSSRSPVHQRQ